MFRQQSIPVRAWMVVRPSEAAGSDGAQPDTAVFRAGMEMLDA